MCDPVRITAAVPRRRRWLLLGREYAYSSPGHPPFRVGAALLTSGNITIKGASIDSASSGKCLFSSSTRAFRILPYGGHVLIGNIPQAQYVLRELRW